MQERTEESIPTHHKCRLRTSYEACKRRHFFKLKRESEMMPFARFKAIYDAQGGRCVESGAPFVFDSKDLFPSPDRTDNNGGYEDGNVRFVVWRVNLLWARLHPSRREEHDACFQHRSILHRHVPSLAASSAAG